MAKKWDTPTDGISRKQFDRAMDSHIRRYVQAMTAIRELELAVARLRDIVGDQLQENRPISEEE